MKKLQSTTVADGADRRRRSRTAGAKPRARASGPDKTEVLQESGAPHSSARLGAAPNRLQFDYNGFVIQSVIKDEQPWFVAADVCAVLGLGNASASVARLLEHQRGIATVNTLGGRQDMIVVSESGLYRLIFTSRKPEAEAFTLWVTDEVLPSIRQTGSYQTSSVQEPVQKTAALQVDLPGPGRYVITAFPGKPTFVRQTEYDAMLAEALTLDRQIMACALASTAAYWHKVKQVQALGLDADGCFALKKLEQAVLDGGEIAARCLQTLWQETAENVKTL